MKHAGAETLVRLAPLVDGLRELRGLVERSPGSFYHRGRAWLHFHEDPAGLFADVKFDGQRFERVAVDAPGDWTGLLARVHASLIAPAARITRTADEA